MATREWLHWIPKLSRSEVLDAIALSRVLAITSRYESSPLVLLEALGLGTPVVSTPVGRASELIEEGVGLAILAWLLASHGMLSREGVKSFLRTGMLELPRKAMT